MKANTFFWRRQWHPTPVLLPGKSHGQSSLVGCSPWGRKESDTTERLPFQLSLSCIGEGNGNPLQCSCLENPRDGGAWWAPIYGVTQSWTRLKQLRRIHSLHANYATNEARCLKTISFNLWDYYPYFTDEKTELQQCSVTCSVHPSNKDTGLVQTQI